MAARRSYSDEERAEALAIYDACGGELREAARQAGVPPSTLKLWSEGRGVHNGCAQLRTEKRETLADRFEALAEKLVAAAFGKIDGATLPGCMTGAGIAVDKMRLLREQPTGIQEKRLSEDERRIRLAEILARARDRQQDAGGDRAPVAVDDGRGTGRDSVPRGSGTLH